MRSDRQISRPRSLTQRALLPQPLPGDHDGGPEPTGRAEGGRVTFGYPRPDLCPHDTARKLNWPFYEKGSGSRGVPLLSFYICGMTKPQLQSAHIVTPLSLALVLPTHVWAQMAGQRGKRWNSGQQLLPGVELCPSDQQRSLIIKGPYATPK